MEEFLKVILWCEGSWEILSGKESRCVIYVLRAIYKKFKRIVLFSLIKDLRVWFFFFFYFTKKILQKFYSHNFVNFLNFSEIISCSQIMWLCFTVLEF